MIRRNPSPLISDTTRIIPSADRPTAPSGRGSTTETSHQSATPLASTRATENSTNRVTGCGNRLPSHSTIAKNSDIAPEPDRERRGLAGGWRVVMDYPTEEPYELESM